MADTGDFYGVLVGASEEDTVLSTAETKIRFRRLEPFHMASAVGQVAINAMENLNCGLPIDDPQIGTGFWGPVDRNALRSGLLAH
jgi:hypothetical protein